MEDADSQRPPDEANGLLDADAEAALSTSSPPAPDPQIVVVGSPSGGTNQRTMSEKGSKKVKQPRAKRAFETEHFLYRQHKYYQKMNHISFGPGRQYYAWGVFFAVISSVCFCGGVIIICVQKFHRWTGFTDKLEFIGPCCFALFVATMGLASFFFYRAYKASCEARRNLRLKGNFDGTGVYLVNPSTDEQTVVTGGLGRVELKTGQKTDKAVAPVDYSQYHNAPYRVYRPSLSSTPTSSFANTPWTKSSLPASYTQPPLSATLPPGPEPTSLPRKKGGQGLPATQTGGALEESGELRQGGNRSRGSSPSLSRAALRKQASVDSSLAETPTGPKATRPSFDQVSVGAASSLTGGGSPRPSRSGATAKKPAVTAMPISHQKSVGTTSASSATGSRPRPKISGMSSLGSASSSTSTKPSTS